jgi:CHRD domain
MFAMPMKIVSHGTLAAMLLLAGCATLEENAVELVAKTHRATLSGSAVAGQAGDPDGYAKAELTVTDQLNGICYDLNDVRGLSEVTSVTINRGDPGASGPVVLRLTPANEGGWKNCVNRSEWLEDAMDNATERYYIQVATTEFPNGAIRGQFSRD